MWCLVFEICSRIEQNLFENNKPKAGVGHGGLKKEIISITTRKNKNKNYYCFQKIGTKYKIKIKQGDLQNLLTDEERTMVRKSFIAPTQQGLKQQQKHKNKKTKKKTKKKTLKCPHNLYVPTKQKFLK